jgi:hypothetical protein
VLQTIALFVTTLPLLPLIGFRAVGIGWLVSYLVGAVALGQAMARRTRARVTRQLLAPVSAGIAAAPAGWLVTTRLGSTLWSGVLGGLVACAFFATLLLGLRRSLLIDSCRFVPSAVRAATRGRDAKIQV